MNAEEYAELDFLMEQYELDSIAFYKEVDYKNRFIELHNKLLPKKKMKYSYPDCINRAYFNIKSHG